MNINDLPLEVQLTLTPDEIILLTRLDLLNPMNFKIFEQLLATKKRLLLLEKKETIRKEKRKNWATFKIIAEDIKMTELSVRRAVDICFKLWNKKPLKDYSEVSMIQNMEYNLKRFREKNKPSIRKDTEEKMRQFAKKYYYVSKENRWYYRENQEE